MTFVTSRALPSSRVGASARTPTVRGTRTTPAAERSFGFTRTSGPPCIENLCRALRPIGVRTVRTWRPANRMSLKTTCRANAVSIRTGTSGVRAGEPGRVLAHDLHGDVGPGVARPDDQHPAVPELCGP